MRPVVVALTGAAFGAALLWQPRRVLALTGADPDLPGAVVAARVLGTRHLLQAVAISAAPTQAARWSGRIDGLHAASMLALATISPEYRRAALASAGVASVLGAGAARSAN